MNALDERNKTLGELTTSLRVRLGFAANGAGAAGNLALMHSLLQEANEYVYTKLESPLRLKRCELLLLQGSTLYDWNNDAQDEPIDPGQVKTISLHYGGIVVCGLVQGITESMRSDNESPGQPERFDTLDGQLEIYPKPDAEYRLVIEYLAGMSPFTQSAHRTSAPSALVFLYALATAKAHYNRPDAQAAAAAFETLMRSELSKQKGVKRYFAKGFEPGRQEPSTPVQQIVALVPSAVSIYTSQTGD